MIEIKHLGMQDYQTVWQSMKQLTDTRDEHHPDELWLLEHPPVYTQGQAGKSEHILNPGNIPVIQCDRGGQVTYHGPGQLVGYVLFDLRRRNLGIRTLVCLLEKAIIATLDEFDITATTRCGAPGVYVDNKKIASIGLRVRKGCTYHGIALNVDMDISPFKGINPCGFQALEMTQIQDFTKGVVVDDAARLFSQHLLHLLGE